MQFSIAKSQTEMGKRAAETAARLLREAITQKGGARLVLSTGASQFSFFEALLSEQVDWSKVEMFHLDEYIDLPESHPASFRKYLKERFTSRVTLKAAHFVNTEGDVAGSIASLSAELRKAAIDVAMIGIGENAHIAFNDPPADFDSQESYMIVKLDSRCKRQQVAEGWFPSEEAVPPQAVTMTVSQIMKSKTIISVVPGRNKAEAIRSVLCAPAVTNQVPATKLRDHGSWYLYIDEEASALLPASMR